MGLEAIGLAAILDDKNFQAGLARYQKGVGQLESATDRGAGVLSRMGSIAGGALVMGIAAGTAAFAAFIAISKIGLDTTLAWHEEVQTLSRQFGMGGEEASAYAVAMEHVGLSVDEGAAGLNYFTRQLDDYKAASTTSTETTKKSADAIDNLQQRLDDANTRLQRAKKTLSEAKKPTDAMRYAVDDAAKAVQRLNDDLADANVEVTKTKTTTETPFAKALRNLGVNAYDAQGKLKTFDEIMPQIMDAFKKLPEGINASALAMDLFGARGGSRFIEFLQGGSNALDEARKKAHLFGLDLSTVQMDAIEAFGRSMNDLGLGLKGFWDQIGLAVLPVAQELATYLVEKIIPIAVELARTYMPQLVARGRELAQWILREAVPRVRDLLLYFGRFSDWIRGTGLPWLQRLSTAFGRGGLAGLLQELGNLVGAFVGYVQKAWPSISAALQGWGRRFWDWIVLTAIPQAGKQLGLIASAIGTWVAQNGPSIAAQLQGWGAAFWSWVQTVGVPMAGEKLGELLAGIRKWIDENGGTIAANFSGIAAGFWGWVTSPGGVVATVAGNMVNAVEAIRAWVSNPKNTQPIWDAVGTWVNAFWQWLTDTKSGLLVSVGDNMVKLTDALKAWTEAKETKIALNDLGKTIANDVIDGIGSIFDDKGKGDNLILRLLSMLNTVRANMADSFKNIGIDIAEGIVNGILDHLNLDPNVKQRISDAFTAMLTAVFNILAAPGGPLIGFVQAMINTIWNNFIAGLNALGIGPGQTPTAPTAGPAGGTAGPAYALGTSFVPHDMWARLHRGEVVIPANQVSHTINYNQRSIGAGAVVINLPKGSALTGRELEEVAYRAVRRVMEEA